MKLISVGAAVGIPKKRGTTPNLFGDDVEEKDDASKAKDLNLDEEDEYDATMGDLDDDNWILDDIGGGLQDDDGDAKWAAKEGIKEMGMFEFPSNSTPSRDLGRCSECHQSATSFPAWFHAYGEQKTIPW